MNDKRKRKTAENLIEKSRNRNHYRGNIKVSEAYETPCFSGQNNLKGDIKIKYNPDYPFHDIHSEEFSSALEAVAEHEIIHNKDLYEEGCPMTQEQGIELVLTPISEELKRKNISNVPIGNQGHTTYTYFGNLFTDFVVNNIGVRNIGSRGFFLLYDDQAHHSKGFGDLFEAFTKLQAMTFPKKTGVSLLLKYFKQSEKPKKAVRNFLSRTKLLQMPKSQRVHYLANPSNWRGMSKIFAEEFSELIDLKNLPDFYFPVFGGNDFEMLNDEDVQMEISMKAYTASRGEFEPPVFMENNLALLALYRQFARNIDIKVNSHSVETERPVAYVSKRKFDFQKDSLERLGYGFNIKGKLEAQTGKYPLKVKSRYQITPGTFPEIRYGFLDCSDSTRDLLTESSGKVMNPWAPKEKQWTDNSVYHQELLCFFEITELSRRRGVLKKSNVKLGSFSGSTRFAKGLEESEKLALAPQFLGTKLSSEDIDELFKGRDCLIYTISDGEIERWGFVKDRFIEGAKRHHYFHLQIGKESQMHRDLKEEGLTSILDDGKNSAGILIDLTQKQIYRGK